MRPTPGWGGTAALCPAGQAHGKVVLDIRIGLRHWFFFSSADLPLGERDVPRALLPLLKDENSELRKFAADTLVMICSDERVVVPALLPMLHDPNPGVRAGLAFTLARYAPKATEIIPALCERLRDINEPFSVRRAGLNCAGVR